MLSITFYDSIKYHRQDFINRDLDFFGNGVVNLSHFPYTLDTPADMKVLIGAGVAWVDGYRIQNDSNIVTLIISPADNTNPRIDIIQIGHDDTNSQAVLMIKNGVAAASPVEPDADPNYLKLFAINVPANATSITASNITDRRTLVPLNVSGTQINLAGAAGTGQTNNFTQTQKFTAPTSSIEANQIIMGQTNNVSSPTSPVYLASADATGVGMDADGNLLPISPSSIPTNGGAFWSILDKLGNAVLKVFKDGSKKVQTANNTLDDGKSNMGLGITPSYGLHQLGGQARIQQLENPSAPTVTVTGAAGTTSYSYYIVATDRNGNKTLPSAVTTITTGNATLSGSNYNTISWTAVPGAVSYDILKADTGHSIATGVTGTSFNDQGAASVAYTAPTRNATADLVVDGTVSEGGTQLSQKYVRTTSNGTYNRIEIDGLLFFTNGGSTQATASYTFSQAFTSAPTILTGGITAAVPYSDTLMYPYIYNVTTTGFSVKLTTANGGNLGTVGTPANMAMNFVAIGN